MAVGSIKHTAAPTPEIIYMVKGTGTTIPGDVVAFDSSGDIIPVTTSTLAPHGVLTDLEIDVSGTAYFGVMMRGYITVVAGGAIKPNKLVKGDGDLDVVAISTTVSTTVLQAEVQEIWKVVGRYVRLESDNQYAPTDAADTNIVIISVGGWN